MGKFKYGLVFNTALPITEIEDWLNNNCSGEWDYSLGGINDSDPLNVKKKLKMYFELVEDIKKFKAEFSKR